MEPKNNLSFSATFIKELLNVLFKINEVFSAIGIIILIVWLIVEPEATEPNEPINYLFCLYSVITINLVSIFSSFFMFAFDVERGKKMIKVLSITMVIMYVLGMLQ